MSGVASWQTAPLVSVLGQWDALTARWALDDEERTALLGGARDGPVDDVSSYDARTAEHRMRLLVALEPVLERILADEDRIRLWLRHPNVNLRQRTPIEVMVQSPEWIRWLLDALGVVA